MLIHLQTSYKTGCMLATVLIHLSLIAPVLSSILNTYLSMQQDIKLILCIIWSLTPPLSCYMLRMTEVLIKYYILSWLLYVKGFLLLQHQLVLSWNYTCLTTNISLIWDMKWTGCWWLCSICIGCIWHMSSC